jgi:hypothetical protein
VAARPPERQVSGSARRARRRRRGLSVYARIKIINWAGRVIVARVSVSRR